MSTVSGWEIIIDTCIRQVLRDVKRNNSQIMKGSIHTVSAQSIELPDPSPDAATRQRSYLHLYNPQSLGSGLERISELMIQKRQTFLQMLKTALSRQFPTANIVIIRHGQVHQCRADYVMRKVEGPIPALNAFFGFGSFE